MKKIVRDTWMVLQEKERKQFALLSILDIIISVLDILSLALLLWIIKMYVQPGESKLVFPSWLGNQQSVSFVAIFFVLFGFKNITGYFISRAQYRFIANVAVRISRHNLGTYQQGSYHDFVNIDSSVFIRKISLQPFEFCQYIVSGIQQIITQSFLILLTIVAIFLFNAKLFLLLLIILMPPVCLVLYVLRKRLTNAKTQIIKTNEKSYQYLQDALKGYVEGNIYEKNAFFLDRFTSQRRVFSKYLFDSLALQTMPSRVIEIFAILGLFILIVIARWSGSNDSASLITVGAFMAAAYKIIPGVVKLVNIVSQIRAYDYSILDSKEKESSPAKDVSEQVRGIKKIALDKVSFAYNDAKIIQNFSIELKQGHFLGLTGVSGKGKTTIINLLLGFLSPSQGQVLVNDVAMDADGLKKYWPGVAYTRQQTFLIYDSILRNVTLDEKSVDNVRLAHAVEITSIDNLAGESGEGLGMTITENGKNISGGQQQRIALARAMYKKADLILLDEPFNELDEASTVRLLEHLKKLAEDGKIIVMITHDKRSLDYCNKVVSLDSR